MTINRYITILWPCILAITGHASSSDTFPDNHRINHHHYDGKNAHPHGNGITITENRSDFPAKYISAFACEFDENPLVTYHRHHGTAAGRAERARDLRVLRSLGFQREARDGDLESVGGKIATPPALTLLNLPVQFVEINGMIGDANAMYVTTFGKGVTVEQVVRAARLEIDRDSFRKYNIRHYSRRIGSNPHIEIYLDDRGGDNAVLVCQVQSTPD